MGRFYPLDQVHQQSPAQNGELAVRLAHLQPAGYPVSPTWVISASVFEQGLQAVVAREPLLGDWPHLFWQPTAKAAVVRPHALAQQLRQSLMQAPVELPWSVLLEAMATPIVRLIPSLWLGDDRPTVGITQLMGTQCCWANPQALRVAVQRLWASAVSGRCWAYWQCAAQPPSQLRLAIVVQPVVPTPVSGRLTRHGDDTCLQMVRGLPEGFHDSMPDHYEGHLTQIPLAAWRRGQQEQIYQPLSEPLLTDQENYVQGMTISETALQVVEPEVWQTLLGWADEIATTEAQSFHWHWQWSRGRPIITQAWSWPFTPNPVQPRHRVVGDSAQWLGRSASPGQVIAPALVLTADQPLPDQAHHHIVVAQQIAPDGLPFLKTAVAIVCEQGGLACHGAILARELGIPAVVGISGITQQLQTGDQLRLDGDRGTIERIKAAASSGPPSAFAPPLPPQPSTAPRSPMPSAVIVPSRWHDCQTELWVNLTQPEKAVSAAAWPIAGVGLLRSEWLILPCLQGRHPYHWLAEGEGAVLQARLMAQLRPILAAFAPRPVRYRSLDLRSHELTTLAGGPAPEVNPTLGVRGTWSYQQYPDLFQLELNALRALQKEGFTNLQLLLPFVRTVEEFHYCQVQVEATNLDLVADFQLWIMAEVPSILFLLSDYVAAGAQGMAIGSNDLTQLLLGIDRDQAVFSQTFDERHPAVQGAIAQLLQQAQALDLPTSICGMAPVHYPEIIPALVQNGITGISVDQSALAATAAAIAQAETQ
jgi:pyruvate,water dikinase